MARAKASVAAVAADPVISTAPLEINPDVEKAQPLEKVTAQGEDGEDVFPSTAKVLGIMSCVYGIMFLGGLVRIRHSRVTHTQGLTMLGPHNCSNSNSGDNQRV